MNKRELLLILASIANDLQKAAAYYKNIGDIEKATEILHDAYVYSKVIEIISNDKIYKRLREQYIE